MISQWFSATRTIGLVAFTVSLLACSVRWAQVRKSAKQGQTYVLLACVQFALLLDMAFDWRWKLHEYGMHVALAEGAYGERRAPQLLTLMILAVILVASFVAILYRFRHRIGIALAMIGTLLSVGLWCSEAISYHFLDRVLYLKIGGAMLVSFLWAGLTVITCLGLWKDTSSYRKR